MSKNGRDCHWFIHSFLQDTELYKRLQGGLQPGGDPAAFRREVEEQAAVDSARYSQHLGRAEFGTLRKRAPSDSGAGARASSR